jgi:hypothetical protein
VLKRPDAPVGGPLGAYLLYNVNLATGEIQNGRRVGSVVSPSDFTGGFAVRPLPEPASIVMWVVGLAAYAAARRRQASRGRVRAMNSFRCAQGD